MSKFKVGDKVVYHKSWWYDRGIIDHISKIDNELYYGIKFFSGNYQLAQEHEIELLEKNKNNENDKKLEKGEKVMSNEEKELKKDVEILLNIYLSDRPMNRKEIKRFSERHYDVIEKQNAKNTLKKRGK